MTSRTAPVTLSVMGRLLRTRHMAWAAILALGGVAFAALTVREAFGIRAAPLTGVVWQAEELVVASSARPDVAPGDRLVAVDGIRASEGRLYALLAEIHPSAATIPLTFERGGRPIDAPVATQPLAELHTVALWVRVVCGILCLLVGVVSFMLTPGTRSAWLFLLFCLNLEVTLLFNILFVRDAAMFARLEPMTFALGASLGLHLFSEMPRRLRLLERRPLGALVPYAPAAPILAVAAILPAPFAPGWGRLALFGAAWSILGGLCSTGVLVSGYLRARRERDEPLVSRYQTLLVAVIAGLFVPVIIHTVRGLTGLGQERWIVHMNAAPVVIYPVATAYALLRQNVLGADRVTTVVVSYGATLILLGLGLGTILVGVPVIVEGRVASSPLALMLTTAAASLSIVPLYRRMKRAIDRRFQRDRASDERITSELRELMRLAMLGDPARTMSGAFQALQVMQPERIELWLREVGGDAFHWRRGENSVTVDGERPPVAVGSALGRAMTGEQVGGVEGLAPSTLPAGAQAELWDRGLALAAPITVQGEVRAFVAVGRHASGSRYRAGEQSFLSMVATQVGLALERGAEGTSIGRYRLERRLGTGGMAEVYLARQLGMAGFERRVAIKRPLPHLTEDAAFVAMLLDEAKLAANLHHPNIVQTYEVDRQAGTYFIAMEYVDGASLRALLRSARGGGEGPPLSITMRIIDALLAALAYAHDAVDARGRKLGVVHRDVTPGNILVSAGGEVKLVDFGVARSTTRLQITQTGMIKGTLAYMAPEQAQGRPVDIRADLFAAGAVIFECLMAQPPYPEGPPKERPTAPPAIGVAVPAALVAVVHRALEFEPAARFASADEMRSAFLVACAPLAAAGADELAAWMREMRGRAPPPEDPFQNAATAVEHEHTEPI